MCASLSVATIGQSTVTNGTLCEEAFLDEMEIGLLHMIMTSNAPLILFDRIINCVQRHSGEIKQNGTDHLMKWEKFIQDLNSKIYGKEIMIKPKVDYTVLSSGCSNFFVTLSVK